MIAHISGKLLQKEFTRAVIDVNGIGFELHIPVSTYDRLPREGESATLKTYLHVREDALQLFGFASEAERQLFVLLITSVSGIGPKMALNALSAMPVTTLCEAVVSADIKALTRISGIGKRTAERLVIELKDRITAIVPSAGTAERPRNEYAGEVEDAVAGLASLGFKAETARKVVVALADELPRGQVTAQNLIRQALAQLNR